MKIDFVDRIGNVLFWLGLADLSAAALVAAANSHPSSLNHSGAYWTVIACGLVAFAVGGFTHFSGWGLRTNGSGNSSPKSPRAPRF